ncbi:hypothetical protein EJB05_41353, partial [Eragrostis curvula]
MVSKFGRHGWVLGSGAEEEEVSATAKASESDEQRRRAEAKERIEAGGATAVLGFSTLSGCLCFPSDAKRATSSARFAVSLFLSFATFLSGISLMLLSLNMLGLVASLVSGGHEVAARCLVVACAALSVLTLLSVVALVPGGVYVYVGLGVVAAAVLPAAAAYWYMGRHAGGGGGHEAPERSDEDRKEMEAVAKVTSSVTNSAFGGLVGVLFSVSKISGAAAAAGRAAYAAIFFMFTTAIFGLFVTNPRFRRLPIAVIRVANAFLLCSLACAAFAASFVVLGYRVFAAFAPLVVTGIICFLLRHCVAQRGGGGRDGEADRENQEAQLKATEDLAGKVTTATFGGIMSVLGSSIGGDKGNGKTGATDLFMIALTSTFVSGFGFMLLAAAPGPAKARLAPAAKVLVWSSMALFAATAVAVYAVEKIIKWYGIVPWAPNLFF